MHGSILPFCSAALLLCVGCGSEDAPHATGETAGLGGADAGPGEVDASTDAPAPATCDAEQADCNGSAKDGCEIDTSSDPLHCGECGNACAAPKNATPTCSRGTCGATCNLGYIECTSGCCGINGVLTAGDQVTCALGATGTTKCWGYTGLHDGVVKAQDVFESAMPLAGLDEPLRGIDANFHICAVTTAGKAMCRGLGTHGQLGDGDTTSSQTPVVPTGLSSGTEAITAGRNHTCALTDRGGVLCWGNKLTGQYGATSPDGVSTVPVGVPLLDSGFVGVSSGEYHACAWTDLGTVHCWGSNSGGALGNGGTTGSATPVEVVGLEPTVLVSCGSNHTCALSVTGTLRCWGGGNAVGSGSVDGSPVPVEVSGIGLAVAVSAGLSHTCALTAAGAVKCWGENDVGQLGNGSTEPSSLPVDVVGGFTAIAIAAGRDHTCAMTPAGGVKCWGSNWLGALGNGETSGYQVPQATPSDVLGMP